jgi:hypothetical protein
VSTALSGHSRFNSSRRTAGSLTVRARQSNDGSDGFDWNPFKNKKKEVSGALLPPVHIATLSCGRFCAEAVCFGASFGGGL